LSLFFSQGQEEIVQIEVVLASYFGSVILGLLVSRILCIFRLANCKQIMDSLKQDLDKAHEL